MSNPNEGESLVNSIRTAAIAMHEMYISFQAAGFTKKEALYLTSQAARGAVKDD